MKNSLKSFTFLLTLLTLTFFLIQCGEKKTEKKKTKLPKRIEKLNLSESQKEKFLVARKEIFTPEIRKKRKELKLKLKDLKKNTEKYKKLKNEINKTLSPYRKQLNEKLKEILTEEQKNIYFKKKSKKR